MASGVAAPMSVANKRIAKIPLDRDALAGDWCVARQ